jgi:hypothetical protein
MMYNKGNYLTNGTKIIYLKKPKPIIIETINKFKEYKEKLIQNFLMGDGKKL